MSDGVARSPRLAAHRGEYRKILREKIDAEQALVDIAAVEKELQADWKALEPAQVGALKVLLDSKWRKVNKFLPDPKAVEHEVGEFTEQLTREQMNVRLAELYATANSRLNGPGSGGVVGDNSGSDSTH